MNAEYRVSGGFQKDREKKYQPARASDTSSSYSNSNGGNRNAGSESVKTLSDAPDLICLSHTHDSDYEHYIKTVREDPNWRALAEQRGVMLHQLDLRERMKQQKSEERERKKAFLAALKANPIRNLAAPGEGGGERIEWRTDIAAADRREGERK